MFHAVDVQSTTIDKWRDGFGSVAVFFSIFFQPNTPAGFHSNFGRGSKAVLAEIVDSDFFQDNLSELCPLNREATLEFVALDRYEFEGSLISMLLHGTCTEAVVVDAAEARLQVAQAISHLCKTLNCGKEDLCAFRLGNPEWSKLISSATLWASYFVFFPNTKTWWFLGFADFY